MDNQPNKRRIKLIQPRLQIKLVSSFVGLTALALLVQFILLGARFSKAAAALPGVGGELAAQVPGMLLGVLAVSFGVLVPIIFACGVAITFRVAGPVHRFEQYLGQIARGEAVGPCHIREGDELQELCQSINNAVTALRVERDSLVEREDQEREALRPAG